MDSTNDQRVQPTPDRRPLALGLAAFALVAACASSPPAFKPTPEDSFLPPELPSGWTKKRIQYANRDMIVAANPLAVDAGVKILARGGSSVDAAIAAQMVLNLVEPQSSGIGGGAFMLYYNHAGRVLVAYDGRETAPAGATEDQFLDATGKPLSFTAAVNGGLSVGTPGTLKMLELAHKKHGKLPWAALFQDAISLAQDGFAISARMNVQVTGSAARLCKQEPAASYFLKPGCIPKNVGTIQKNPDFAATLRAIADGGSAAFYSGALAKALVDKVRSHPTNPGRLSRKDLAGYQAKVREPVCGDYRGFKVCGMPSSGGVTVLQTLGILRNFNMGRYQPNSVDAVHLVSEAYRLAYADRSQYLADSDFVSVPVAGLLDPSYLKARAGLIKMDRSMGMPSAGTPSGAMVRGVDTSSSQPSTSHMVIVDQAGDVVSMTTSIENGFGSMQMVGGFLLNNQLADFSFTAMDAQGRSIANRVEPGKRPRSSMAPMVVLNAQGEIEAIVGSPGGGGIIHYVVKTIIGVIDWNLDIQQAINLSNFGAQTSATTSLEIGTPITSAADGLRRRGHVVSLHSLNSGVHGIVFNGHRSDGTPGRLARDPSQGKWAGGADPRREGVAKGNN